MGFTPPQSSSPGESAMEFMLLGAADQTGRAVLYDPARHTVRTMPSLKSLRHRPVALTVNGNDLYVMNAIPNLPSTMFYDGRDHGFDMLAFRSASSSPKDQAEGDWCGRELPSIPCEREEPDPQHGIIRAASTVVERGEGVLVSKHGMGTYAFDTARGEWSKVGCWMLPFAGHGEFVPEHGLWFGLTPRARDDSDIDTNLLCAVDLGSTTRQRPPTTVRGLSVSGHAVVVPPVEWGWMPAETSRLVNNLGNARFCVARFFVSGEAASTHRYAVFAGVEVERRCGGDGDAGELRVVMHRSEVYPLLPRKIMY